MVLTLLTKWEIHSFSAGKRKVEAPQFSHVDYWKADEEARTKQRIGSAWAHS